MRLLSVYGSSGTGKTTTIEAIIKELKKRGYSVGSIKEIHYESFQIDTPGTNTSRHRAAGADLVTARGASETDIMYPGKLSLAEILRHYDHDFVICEGIEDACIAKVLTGSDTCDLDQRWSRSVIAVSGVVSTKLNEYRDIPAIDALTRINQLVDLIEEKALPPMPDFDPDCCSVCGMSCQDFCDHVLKGTKKISDCVLHCQHVNVYVDDHKLELVPFVQDMIKATVSAMIGQLRGYREHADIRVEIKNNHDV